MYTQNLSKNYGTLYPISETSKIKPRKIIGFDLETHGDNNDFLMGTIYTNDKQLPFYNKEKMQEYLLSQENDTYIVASNLHFDFSVLFYNSEYFYQFQQIINGSQLVSAIYEGTAIQKKYVNVDGKEQLYKRRTIYFIDTYNYMQGSVEYYGKILGIQKLEKPKTLSEIPRTPEEWKELETYCMRDSEITYKFTMFLQENYNIIGTNMKLTASSTSMELFKRKYLHRNIHSEESHMMNINKKLFDSYYGGRTEIFKRGYYKNMKYYDFNSLYPSVMMNDYPDPDSAKYVTFPSKNIIEYEGISEVIMEVEEMNVPILPVMHHKLIFPIGRIRGTYTHLEIRKAIDEGYTLKKIMWTIYYRKVFKPFETFVNDMYSKRMEFKKQKNPTELVFKLLMNSLYGKFAQKNMSEIKFIDYNNLEEKERIFLEYPEHHGIKYTHNKDGKGYLVKKGICTSSFVRPIFSTYTTAYGRMKLWDVVNKYDGAYSDTDSIVTRKEVGNSLILGDLKLETTIRKGIFVKPKCYTFTDVDGEEVTRLKGVPRANINTFEKILEHKNVNYMKFTKMKESIKRGFNPNRKVMMSKKMNLEDDKRIWTMNFNPYFYDEFSKPHKVIM